MELSYLKHCNGWMQMWWGVSLLVSVVSSGVGMLVWFDCIYKDNSKREIKGIIKEVEKTVQIKKINKKKDNLITHKKQSMQINK